MSPRGMENATTVISTKVEDQVEAQLLEGGEPLTIGVDETIITSLNIESNEENPIPTYGKCLRTKISIFYNSNSFLILIIFAILLAFAYPELGYLYLFPKITATWITVIIIFFLSGISLESEELKNACKRLGFNLFVQLYNFGFVSVFMYGIKNLITYWKLIPQSLADGMMIGVCVPITINTVLVLTKSSNGDEAAALFNAVFGNLLGVFISPLLILLYLGQNVSVNIGDVFFKLCLRVLLPIAVGQLIHRYSVKAVKFVNDHKKQVKKIHESCFIFIVYTIFCTTFYEHRKKNDDASSDIDTTTVADTIIMITCQFVILLAVMIIAWTLLKVLYPNQPTLRVMGLYGCTHKSVAMGIPLINTIYEENPNIGFYTLPLLIWYLIQVIIGTFLSPRLAEFVDREEERAQLLQGDQNDVGGSLDI